MRVDIIVPCYNYAQFLPYCLNSILSQDADLKVLVIDDCSSDNTAEVAAEFAAADSRVEFRRHAVNKGHIATYNEGLNWSSGDLTLLISADDMLTEGALARAVAFMQQHPGAGMVHGRVIKVKDTDSHPAPQVGEPSSHQLMCGRNWIEKCCEAGMNLVYSPEAITRTSLQKEIGGYDPDLPHTADYDMWMRFASMSDIGVLNADQAYYRVHNTNMHSVQFGNRLKELKQIGAAYEKFFSANSNRIQNCSALAEKAYTKLAVEAIRAARYAYDIDPALDYTYRDALNYATEVYPAIRLRRVYWSFYRRFVPGANALNRIKVRRNTGTR